MALLTVFSAWAWDDSFNLEGHNLNDQTLSELDEQESKQTDPT